jgi:hypothetical protein
VREVEVSVTGFCGGSGGIDIWVFSPCLMCGFPFQSSSNDISFSLVGMIFSRRSFK